MQKLSILIIPFVICYILALSLPMALRWLIEIKLGTNRIDQEILDLWGPVLVSFLIFWLVLKKRINIIKSEKLTPFFFIAFISVTTMLPNFFMQDFVSNASFELISINNPDDIQQVKDEKFFKISNFSVKHDLSAFYNDFKVSGKYSERITMRIYAATPIVSNRGLKIWHGVVFNKSISNRVDDDEKEVIFKKFYRDTLTSFRGYDFKKVDYFKLLRKSYKTEGLLSAINTSNSKVFILEPIKGEFAQRRSSSIFDNLLWVLVFFMIPLIFMLFAKVNKAELNKYLKPQISNLKVKKLLPSRFQSIGRNHLCPCGSGHKYKKCCLKQK